MIDKNLFFQFKRWLKSVKGETNTHMNLLCLERKHLIGWININQQSIKDIIAYFKYIFHASNTFSKHNSYSNQHIKQIFSCNTFIQANFDCHIKKINHFYNKLCKINLCNVSVNWLMTVDREHSHCWRIYVLTLTKLYYTTQLQEV